MTINMYDKDTSVATCILCIFLFICNVSCHSINDSKRLLADKMNGYEKNFRPLVNQSRSMQLFVGLELVSIQDFDEVKEQLTIAAIVTTFWFDELMTWDPSDYGGLNQLVIESDNVWTPNLVLVNTVDKLEKIGDAWQLIRFLPTGFAYYYPGNVFSASCRVDVTYYPLDRHRCKLTFSTWAQSDVEISITPYVDYVLTTYFSENGVWTFYSSSVSNYSDKSSIDFFLYLERKPRFVLVNVIIPIIFMAFLNTIIFAIPVESGERISYSITVLLALAVFITLVGDNLPKTSSPMSLFGYYLLVVLIISICITLATVFNVRLYYKDDNDHVPDWIAGFVKCLQCRSRKTTKKRKNSKSKNDKENIKIDNGRAAFRLPTNKESFICVSGTAINDYHHLSTEDVKYRIKGGEGIHQIKSFTNYSEKDNAIEEKNQKNDVNDIMVSWKVVSLALDKIFFVLSFLVIIISTIIFFVSITGNNIH